MKQKRLKKYESEDSSEIRNLIIITVIIALIATGLYFLTEKVLNKKENNNTSEVTFNYDEATIGTMFNRPYDEYYAFIYDSTDDNSAVYNNIVKTYRAKDNAKNVIYCNGKDLLYKLLALDYDGDHLMITTNPLLIKIAGENMKDIRPIVSDMVKGGKQIIDGRSIFNNLKATYGGSNWNLQQ